MIFRNARLEDLKLMCTLWNEVVTEEYFFKTMSVDEYEEKLLTNPDFSYDSTFVVYDEYHNLILENNEQVFQEQIELFSFFFGTDGMDDVKRWDFIEDYFTGMGVEELKAKYAAPL